MVAVQVLKRQEEMVLALSVGQQGLATRRMGRMALGKEIEQRASGRTWRQGRESVSTILLDQGYR